MATYADFSSTKLGFKIGTQANLEKYLTSGDALYGKAVEGCFYLTNDTHRLYIGRKLDSTTNVVPVPVNEGITTVTNEADLPTTAHAGEFYYISSKGVLAVCAKEGNVTGKWLQLNQDTQLDNATSSITVGDVTSKASTITVLIKDTANNAVSKTFTIAGGNNVTLEKSGNTLTINSTDHTYSMSAATGTTANTANIRLHNGATTTTPQDTIAIGTDATLGGVTYEDGKITINGVNYNNTGVTVANGTGSGTTASTNGFKVSVAQNGATKSGDFDPQIKINSDAAAVHFVNGVATLNGYTASEVDAKISAAKDSMNAMTYCGLVNSATALAGKTFHNGDTYKASARFEVTTGNWAELGDLIIVQGLETDGVIPAASATFEIIPSGDEITVTGKPLTHGIEIDGARNGDAASLIASLVVTSGDGTDGLQVADSGSGNAKTVTLSHKGITLDTKTGTTQSQNSGSSKTFTVVTGAEIDAYGHLQKIETSSLEVTDSHNAITSVSYAATATNNIATVTETVKTSDDTTGKSGSFTIKSETLNVTASSSQVVMDLIWGSF